MRTLGYFLRFQLSEVLFVGALFFLLIGSFVWFTARSNWLDKQKYEPVAGRITGFGLVDGNWGAGNMRVSVITPDGFVGGANVRQQNIRGCKVGDLIKAERFGMTIRLEPAPCDEKPPDGNGTKSS